MHVPHESAHAHSDLHQLYNIRCGPKPGDCSAASSSLQWLEHMTPLLSQCATHVLLITNRKRGRHEQYDMRDVSR